MDYNFQGVVLYRKVACAAVSVAARAAGMVSEAGNQQELALQSDCLMREVSLLSLLVRCHVVCQSGFSLQFSIPIVKK